MQTVFNIELTMNSTYTGGWDYLVVDIFHYFLTIFTVYSFYFTFSRNEHAFNPPTIRVLILFYFIFNAPDEASVT